MGDECDQILELVERKYKENQSEKEPRKEDSGLQKRLEKAVDRIPDGSLMTVSSTDCAR